MELPKDRNVTAVGRTEKAQKLLQQVPLEYWCKTKSGRRTPVAFFMNNRVVGKRLAGVGVPELGIKKGDMVEADVKKAKPRRIYEKVPSISPIRLHANSEAKIDYYLMKGFELVAWFVPAIPTAPLDHAYDAPTTPGINPYRELASKLVVIQRLQDSGASVEEMRAVVREKEELEERVSEMEKKHKAEMKKLEAKLRKEIEQELGMSNADKNQQEQAQAAS